MAKKAFLGAVTLLMMLVGVSLQDDVDEKTGRCNYLNDIFTCKSRFLGKSYVRIEEILRVRKMKTSTNSITLRKPFFYVYVLKKRMRTLYHFSFLIL